jgi:hypothetical protein
VSVDIGLLSSGGTGPVVSMAIGLLSSRGTGPPVSLVFGLSPTGERVRW